jgi:F0F1-type ATP synthase assembly protein I
MENIFFIIMVVIMLGAGVLTFVYESGDKSNPKQDDLLNSNGKERK